MLAAPLVLVELWFDVRSRSRRLIPELAGTAAIGAVAAAIVLADGGEADLASAAWALAAFRAVATIPFVRVQLARLRDPSAPVKGSDLAQVGVIVGAVASWWSGWMPGAAALAVVLLGAAQLALSRADPPRVAVIGAQQVVFGLTLVLVAGLALAAP